MRVLITGGAGFLGLHLARFFHTKKWNIRILDIAHFPEEEYPEGTEYLQGDVRDYENVNLAIKGCDVVIHAAAALPLRSGSEIMSTNVDGTRNVLEESLKQKMVRVVYI